MFRTSSNLLKKTLLFGFFAFLLWGCSDLISSQPTPQVTHCDIQVEPLFRELYNLLNIQNQMGCAISPVFHKGNYTLQYTQAGLLRYDHTQPDSQRFSLEPLGQQNLQPDTPLALTGQEGSTIIDGRIIYDKFVSLFTAMGGTRYVGKPITQPFIDDEKHWIVQFFNNLAYYTSFIDLQDGVHLVQLGALACGDTCSHPPVGGFIPGKPEITEPFLEHLRRLGFDLTGQPLSYYTLTPDGYIDQIYENVAIHVKNTSPYLISFLPLGSELEMDPTSDYFKPAARIDDPSFIFNPDRNNNKIGFNEEILFEQWVAMHGSKAISGPVISQIFLAGTAIRQCYANYCLDFDPVSQTISPVALGKEYLSLHPAENTGQGDLTLTSDNTILKIAESNSLISSQDKQTISVWVFQRRDQIPIPNVDAVLTVVMPDGSKPTYNMPPTDVTGKSSHTLAPINATNGTMVPYQVCLNTASTISLCSEESFTIWFNPN